MKSNKTQQRLPINPIIAKLLSKTEEPVVQFRGFLGETTDGNVAIYRDFSLTKYVEIPASSILHVTQPECDESPVTVFVPASTKVSMVQKQRADRLIGASPGVLDSGFCVQTCTDAYIDCQLSGYSTDTCDYFFDKCISGCGTTPALKRYGGYSLKRSDR